MSYVTHPGRAFEDHDEPEDDEPTFADRGVVRRHTARRALSCDDCPTGRGIQPGERYAVHVGLDEHGDFFCERSCAATPDACRAARAAQPDPPEPIMEWAPYPHDDDHLPF